MMTYTPSIYSVLSIIQNSACMGYAVKVEGSKVMFVAALPQPAAVAVLPQPVAQATLPQPVARAAHPQVVVPAALPLLLLDYPLSDGEEEEEEEVPLKRKRSRCVGESSKKATAWSPSSTPVREVQPVPLNQFGSFFPTVAAPILVPIPPPQANANEHPLVSIYIFPLSIYFSVFFCRRVKKNTIFLEVRAQFVNC